MLEEMLLIIPQRYKFSSKSQPGVSLSSAGAGLLIIPQRYKFSSKSQRHRWRKHQPLELLIIPQRYKFWFHVDSYG